MDVTESDFEEDGHPSMTGLDELPEEQAPEEIENDALEELNRIHQEMQDKSERYERRQAEYDPSYGMGGQGGGFGGSMAAFQPVVERTPRHEEQEYPGAREYKTVEDLYATWPAIGNGEYYLRVERKHPASWQGQRVAGFLEDVHHQISMREFSEKYGGHTYEVSVRGPSRTGDGIERTLKTIRIQVPGPPKTASNDDMDPFRVGRNGQVQAGSELYEIKRLELEYAERAEARRREDEMRRRQEAEQRTMRSKPMFDPQALEQVRQLYQEQTGVVTSVHQDTIKKQFAEIQALKNALDTKDRMVQDLRDELLQVRADAANRWKEEESRQIRDLKEHQSRDMQRISEEHAATISRIQGEHDRRIQQLTEQHQREVSQLRDSEQRERERLRDDAHRREQSFQDELNRREQAHRDREAMLRDEFTRREDANRRDLENRIQMMERQNKRDVEMIRSTESTKAVFTEQTAQSQMSFMNMQLQQANQRAEAAEQEAAQLRDELMRHTSKPLLQQVEETKTIGEALGLFDKKEEKRDWKESLVDGLSNALKGAPDVVRSVVEAREQNQRAAMQARQVQAQQRALAQQRQRQVQHSMTTLAAPPPMAPPVMGPSVQPAPPPQWDTGPGDPSSGPAVPEHLQGPPRPEPRREPTHLAPDVEPPRERTPPPVYDESPMPDAAPLAFAMGPDIRDSNKQEPEGDSQSSQDAPEPIRQSQSAAEDVQIDQESIFKFVEKLEVAIGVGVVPPSQFARGFVDEASVDATRQLLERLSPETLIQLVAQSDTDNRFPNIVSRAGRKYIVQLWQEAGKLVV